MTAGLTPCRPSQTKAVRERGELPKARAVGTQAAASVSKEQPIDTQVRRRAHTGRLSHSGLQPVARLLALPLRARCGPSARIATRR